MPIIPDAGGGGSTTNICAPTPSDLAGQINNILTRLDTLEKTVAELQGQDVSATQLSDLAQQVGWVYDVTYLGVPGWIQTEAGTLIPPPGVSLSSLGIILPGLGNNPSQLVSMDSDGNPTFSINQSGTVTGGGSGGASSYISCEPASATITSLTPDISTINSQAGTAFTTANLSSGTIDIVEAGFYWASVSMPADSFGAGSGYKYMQVAAGSKIVVDALFSNGTPTTDTHKAVFKVSFGFRLQVADLPSLLNVSFVGVTSLMGSFYTNGNVDIVKLA